MDGWICRIRVRVFMHYVLALNSFSIFLIMGGGGGSSMLILQLHIYMPVYVPLY